MGEVSGSKGVSAVTLLQGGIVFWFGTPDAPVPEGRVDANNPIPIVAGVRPIGAVDRVEARYQVDAGPLGVVVAEWLRDDPATNSRYYRAYLPACQAGQNVLVTLTCHYGDRQIPVPSDLGMSTFAFSTRAPQSRRIRQSDRIPSQSAVNPSATQGGSEMASPVVSKPTVKIRLLSPDGSPAAGQWVTVLDPSGISVDQIQAASDGTVSVLPKDGNVVFRVGKGISSPYFVDAKSQPADRPISVRLGKETRGTIRMYGQVVDKTGQPAAGVGLVIWRQEDKAALATTVSDSNGAFLLSFSTLDTTGKTYVLELSVNEDPIPLPDLESLTGGLYGPHCFIVEHRPPPNATGVAPRPFLMGNEEETLTAFKKAPQLFMRPLPARAPDPCSPYTPGEVATRVYQLNQLVMFPVIAPPATTTAPATAPMPPALANPAINPIDFLTSKFPFPREQPIRYGAVVEFRQEWWDLGFTLGNLLYSVPLAPCEETKIATVDWRRKDYAKRQSALDESFYQDTTISRDEAINEAVRMTSNKTVTDSTEGGGGSISLGFIGGGYAKTVETMTDVADVSTTASRYINDRIQQVSNTLRNTRAFSVVEATQEEESVVRTRVLRNHNHCHTVTFQYYEVLRNFLISTLVQKVRPVIFVPAVIPTFTADLVQRYAYVLRRALLDPTLQPVLDNLLGVSQVSTGAGAQATAGTAVTGPGADGTGGTIIALHLRSLVTQPPPASGGSGFGFGGSAGGSGSTRYRAWIPNCALVVETGSKGSHLLRLQYETVQEEDTDGAKATPSYTDPSGTTQPWSISPLDIERVGLYNYGPADLDFDDVQVVADLSDGSTRELFFTPSWSLPQQRRQMASITGLGGLAGTASQTVDLGRLLDHLNANAVYYAGAVITAGDAGLRWLVLSGLNDGQGSVLADIVDNNVAGSIGNYLGFPLTGPEHLPAQYGAPDGSWLANPPEETIVPLPTAGVFAESQLGGCSACEPIDQTRFWDWSKSPCPDDAPGITDAMLASRYQNLKDVLDFLKGTLVPSPVQIPEEPKPMITIGDATLQKMLDLGQFSGSKDLLDFIGKLVDIAAKGFKDMSNAQGNPGANQGGLGAMPGDGSGAAAGGAAADPSTAAAGGGLDASAATAAEAAVIA